MAPIRVLHLSDLHIEAEADPIRLLQPLEQDLSDPTDGLGVDRLDYLVVSGDLSNRANPAEFKAASGFLAKLIERFCVAQGCVVIVPGNHDQSWDPSPYDYRRERHIDKSKLADGRYIKEGTGYLVRDESRYAERFVAFSKHLYEPLIGKPYPIEAAQQGVTFLAPNGLLQFILLNSSAQIDEFFPERSSIDDSALASALSEANKALTVARSGGVVPPGAKPLRIAVWHHPVSGTEAIGDDAFLGRLQQADVRLCMHGHVHKITQSLIGYTHPTRKMHVSGAGSFGAPAKDRPESVPALYNLLEIEPTLRSAKVHTRGRAQRGGAFSGHAIWPGADPHSKRSYYEVDLGDHGWPTVSAPSSASDDGPDDRELRKALLVYFDRVPTIRMLLGDARVDVGSIAFERSAYEVWGEALIVARRMKLLRRVLQIACEEYPNALELQTLAARLPR